MENEMNMRRFAYIDLLEVIALIFVVVYHSPICSYDILNVGGRREYFNYVWRTVFTCGVPLFFLANGFLLFSKKLDLKKHIKKTIKLTVLTIIWGVILLLLIMPIVDVHFTVREFFEALWTWKLGWINQLWYMGALVGIYIFFPLLKLAYDQKREIFVFFVAVCGIMTLGNDLINWIVTFFSWKLRETHFVYSENWFNMFNPFRGTYAFSFVYFCVGGLLVMIKDKIESTKSKKNNIISVTVIILSVLILAIWGMLCTKFTGILWDTVWNGYNSVFALSSVVGIFILSLKYRDRNNWFSRLIRLISSNTLGIYFLHVIFILLTLNWARNIPFLCTAIGNTLYALIIILFTCLVTLLLRKLPILNKLVK